MIIDLKRKEKIIRKKTLRDNPSLQILLIHIYIQLIQLEKANKARHINTIML